MSQFEKSTNATKVDSRRTRLQRFSGTILFQSAMGRIMYAAYEQWNPPKNYYSDVDSEPFKVTANIELEVAFPRGAIVFKRYALYQI